MLFNTLDFFLFLAVILPIYYLLPFRFRTLFLLAASCYFYIYFIPIYIFLMFAIIIVDYLSARGMDQFEKKGQQSSRKYLFFISLSVTSSVLIFFKYLTAMALPFGLSFHTFQGLSYVIEVYKGRYKAEKDFKIYSLFVMFFPQLVAGPIERPQDLLPQLKSEKSFQFSYLKAAAPWIVWGLFKKVVISEKLALLADPVFADVYSKNGFELFLAVLFVSVQIYCDFSGYSDIAYGVGKLFGIELSLNFKFPFFAKSFRDFWRHYHITLTRWFRDYVYSPLIKLKPTFSVKAGALMSVFLLSGIWHGSHWTFVICGLIHGTICLTEFYLSRFASVQKIFMRLQSFSFFRPIQGSYILLAYASGVLFFRSENMTSALEMVRKIFQFTDWKIVFSVDLYIVVTAFVLAIFLFLAEAIWRYADAWKARLNPQIFSFLKVYVLCSLFLATMVLSPFRPTAFIYFQF